MLLYLTGLWCNVWLSLIAMLLKFDGVSVSLKTTVISLKIKLNDDFSVKIRLVEWLNLYRRMPCVRFEVYLGERFRMPEEDADPLFGIWVPAVPISVVLPLLYCAIHTSAGTFWVFVRLSGGHIGDLIGRISTEKSIKHIKQTAKPYLLSSNSFR